MPISPISLSLFHIHISPITLSLSLSRNKMGKKAHTGLYVRSLCKAEWTREKGLRWNSLNVRGIIIQWWAYPSDHLPDESVGSSEVIGVLAGKQLLQHLLGKNTPQIT